MENQASAETPANPSADLSGLTDYGQRLLACRTETATILRGIQAVAGLAATNLEAGGTTHDFAALYTSLGILGEQLGGAAEHYGHLLSVEGAA